MKFKAFSHISQGALVALSGFGFLNTTWQSLFPKERKVSLETCAELLSPQPSLGDCNISWPYILNILRGWDWKWGKSYKSAHQSLYESSSLLKLYSQLNRTLPPPLLAKLLLGEFIG